MANNKNFIAKNGVSTGDGYAMPDVRPSLLLDFANSKTLDPRITFTRGSTATYWDGKTTTKAEENLQPRSADFNSTYWLSAQTTFNSNYATAPDGTSTAGRLYEDAVNAAHYIHGDTGSTVTTANGVVYTWSIYAKKGSGTSAPDNVQLCFRGNTHSTAYANFNISTGVVASSFNLDASSITDVGNGWYRLVITATANSAGSGGGGVFVLIDDNASANRLPAYAGDTNADVLLWGPQFEQRSSATAYTATTSAPIVKYQPTLQTAASGEARFDHDPVTGESKGLLIEEARTNSLTFSEEFDHSSFTKQAVTVEANQAVAPDGTLTADKLVVDSGATTHQITKLGVVSSQTCAVSIFAKAAGVNTFTILDGAIATNGASFNLSTGVATDVNSGTGSIEDVGNGWYRCTAVMTTTGFRLYCPDGTGTAVGDGFNGIFIWGVQLEAGAFPTSYIPTSGSTVTRPVEVAKVDNFNNYATGNEGTAFMDWIIGGSDGSQEYQFRMESLNGSGLAIFYDDPNIYGTNYNVSNSGTVSTSTSANKAALTYSQSEGTYRHYANGTAGTGTTSAYDGRYAPNVLFLGGASATASHSQQYIKKFAFYPQRLSNATLTAMTED